MGERTPTKPRQYSDAEKAQALVMLDECGGNAAEASRKLGIPRPNIEQWSVLRGCHPDVLRLKHDAKRVLAERWEALADQALGLLPGKLEGASAGTLATIAAIATDKSLLLRGQPTEITEQRLPQEEVASRLLSLVEQARKQGAREAREARESEGITTIEGEVR